MYITYFFSRQQFFYLLDYVTPIENFQIGDHKKKKDMDSFYSNICIVFERFTNVEQSFKITINFDEAKNM